MFKRMEVMVVLAFCISFGLLDVCYGLRLFTKEEALKKVFEPGVEIITENKVLAEPALSKIKEKLGGSLFFVQKGSNLQGVEDKGNVDFYFALKNGQKIGVAVIDAEPGKWGAVELIIAMDLKGSVIGVEVMNSEEKRGQPVSRASFTGQYKGKSGKDPLEVGKDITGISGATITSRCTTFAVKKAVVLYQELYLNNMSST